MSRNVFKKNALRSEFSNMTGDNGPQMSPIVRAPPRARGGKGLAGKSADVPINPGKVGGRELGEISTPNRRLIQPPRLHLRNQIRDTECFPFHHAHCSRWAANRSKSGAHSEVESPDAGTDAEYVIHKMAP